MTLQGIRSGDIVRAEGILCFVVDKEGRELIVRGCHGSTSLRRVKGRSVTEHWRQAGTSKRASLEEPS